MPSYPELDRAFEELAQQSDLYRPTSFWEEASLRIASEIRTRGIEPFRSLPTALSFFVPTYGFPGNSFTPALMDAVRGLIETSFVDAKKPKLALSEFIDGQANAFADYRVLCASDSRAQLPFLHRFSESTLGEPVEQYEFEGRRFSRSALNYLLGLAFLKRHLNGDVPRTVLEIGGGFASLGEVLSASGIDGIRYIDVDIPPTSFAASYYLSGALGSDKVRSPETIAADASIEIDRLPPATVLHSWQIERLRGTIDLFVNFISFQEMEPAVVKNYLAHVHRLSPRWILLRNMREGKQVRSKANAFGVETPIVSEDYIDMLAGYRLVDRNVVPFGYRTVDGFHSELLLFQHGERMTAKVSDVQ